MTAAATEIVPALVARLTALRAARPRLEAVLVGGAQMLSLGGPAATRGSKGRTIRVLSSGFVLSKEAGGAEIELMQGVRA